MSTDDVAANEFFKQAVADGKMSEAEYLELTGNAASYTPPNWVTLLDAMSSAGATFREALEQARRNRISATAFLAYLNYPAYSETQIAERLGVTQQRVSRMIAKMRRTFPALRGDVSIKTTGASFPDLRHMRHIEASTNSDNLLDSTEVTKF